MPRSLRPLVVLLALLAPLLLGPLLVAPPASAHPFGPPQTAEVSASGDRVLVQWRFGATDDISYLAAALEALPPERILLDGVVLYEEGDDELLATSDAFEPYVLEHLAVTRGGSACSGTVDSASDLAADGVVVGFACPSGTGPVSVTVDMLTDLHPAYRTLATGPSGQKAVYAADTPSHDWSLSLAAAPAESLEASAARQMGLVAGGLGLVLAVALGGWWGWRRRAPARSAAAARRG